MRTDPAIAALRRDRAPQRLAQAATVAAYDAWRAIPRTREVLADFERYGADAPLMSCSALAALFSDADSAPGLVAALVRELHVALATEPFGHPPFRHAHDRGASTLLLARSRGAHLVLHACEPGRRGFDTAAFSDAERHEAVLAGRASARIVHRAEPAESLPEQPLTLEPGVRLALDLREQALQVLDIERRLVSLRLHRSARDPGPSHEYDISTGVLLRQASGDIRASRCEAMLALLGRMRRPEAAPVMAAVARESGDASLRWQALRECLALDTAAGFAALCDLACAVDDPLAAPAGVLRAQLAETHPELRALEPAPCLA